MAPTYSYNAEIKKYVPKLEPDKEKISIKVGQELDSNLKNSDSIDPEVTLFKNKKGITLNKQLLKLNLREIFESFNGPLFKVGLDVIDESGKKEDLKNLIKLNPLYEKIENEVTGSLKFYSNGVYLARSDS